MHIGSSRSVKFPETRVAMDEIQCYDTTQLFSTSTTTVNNLGPGHGLLIVCCSPGVTSMDPNNLRLANVPPPLLKV